MALAFAMLVGLVTVGLGARSARAGDLEDCLSPIHDRRMAGCTSIIDDPGVDLSLKSVAHAHRALAFALKGEYLRALPDYDTAIYLDPRSAMAHNNRAWVLWKLRRIDEGLVGVDRALKLDPSSHQAHDTRAHLKQGAGDQVEAMRSYDQAMQLGGTPIIKIYQCGLAAQGLFKGEIDGKPSHDLRRALLACVAKPDCDPLPPEEDCVNATS